MRKDKSLNSISVYNKEEKVKSPLLALLPWAAISGIILFTLWISYNAINDNHEGHKAPSRDVISK